MRYFQFLKTTSGKLSLFTIYNGSPKNNNGLLFSEDNLPTDKVFRIKKKEYKTVKGFLNAINKMQ